jgi:hypothetical protein
MFLTKNEDKKMKVLLVSGTVGEVGEAKVGEVVIVTLHDENGIEIKEKGEVEEILIDD